MNVFDSIVFIKRFRHGSRRVVDNVWRFDASSKSFELAYSGAEGFSSALDGHLESRKKELAEWETFLKRCIRQGISAIEDVAYALREYSSSREVKAEYAEPLS